MMNKPEDASDLKCSEHVHALLTLTQMDLCERRDNNYPLCMAPDIKRAIHWCQMVFKDPFRNCTNWVGDYVLGIVVYRCGELQCAEAKYACNEWGTFS